MLRLLTWMVSRRGEFRASFQRVCSIRTSLPFGYPLRLYYSVDNRTGKAVAIKVVDVENAEDEVEDIIQEIAILSELNSPYVTRYYGSFLKGSNLWIVMEFCSGGSCSDLMRPGTISEDYIMIILRELLRGLDYLHNDQKLHRDVKGTLAGASS